ncbi:Polysaccharide deacetylase [Verrucomicrobium sp. GAS474]|uniref:polysaccharide deacetylase family protein n=1 Tax=Verrucomicrobium sp. GAS474 TaxID=1882831 RepID=UPI0008793E04|nr:polysaccharide deacetylase family protein [Verrucomicrobium sp. GAS474]SDT88473.1 Polysaccharide deacetylase [Verrucomicrobium sp. GAS474]
MALPSIRLDLFPGGVSRAVTLSYDDGVVEDRRLVEILNAHGLKGTFHLNSGVLGREKKLAREEIATLFAGHEISAHSVTHPHLDALSREELAREILDDRAALEALAGYPVRGMSYPFGTHSPEVVSRLPHLGIEYARTVESHGRFHVPENLLLWHPTCHHKHDLAAKAEEFFTPMQSWQARLRLLYVWGHSYEFPNDNNWDVIERFAERVAKEGNAWCATNIEIADYLRAQRALRCGVDGRQVQNLASRPVWITWNGEAREIAAGAVATL